MIFYKKIFKVYLIMKKKKSLYKLIKKELADLTVMLSHISRNDNDIFKQIALQRTRTAYFDTYIRPLMVIYQISKKYKLKLYYYNII